MGGGGDGGGLGGGGCRYTESGTSMRVIWWTTKEPLESSCASGASRDVEKRVERVENTRENMVPWRDLKRGSRLRVGICKGRNGGSSSEWRQAIDDECMNTRCSCT